MRGQFAFLAVCTTLMLGLALRASEKPTDGYQKMMKELAAANTALRNDVKAVEAAGAYPDYQPVEKDASTLKSSFDATLAFWTARKAEDAVKAATAGSKAVDELVMAIKDKNYDAVVASTTAIGATCASCHTPHRERLPDGTFEIK